MPHFVPGCLGQSVSNESRPSPQATLENFRLWLAAKYETPAELSRAWRRPIASFDAVDDPLTRPAEHNADLAAGLDWLDFTESHVPALPQRLTDHLPRYSEDSEVDPVRQFYQRLRTQAREFTLLDPGRQAAAFCRRIRDETSPHLLSFALRAAAMHDPAGHLRAALVSNPSPGPGGLAAAVCRHESQTPDEVSSFLHPSPLGEGGPSGPGEGLLLHPSPLRGEGRVRVSAVSGEDVLGPSLSPLLREPWEADRKVLILYPEIYARIARLAALFHSGMGVSPMSPTGVPPVAAVSSPREIKFGFDRPIQTEGPALLAMLAELAAKSKYAFAITDTRLPPEELRRWPLVICPTLELLDAATIATLDAYVAHGGYLALGPRIPVCDERGRSDDCLARHIKGNRSELSLTMLPYEDGCFITMPNFVTPGTIDFLGFESGLARGLAADSEHMDSTLLRLGRRRLLFIANPMAVPLPTAVSGEPFSHLRNVETGEETAPGKPLELAIPAATIQIWEVF